jgi:transcription initiation factor TFIID subunit 10
MSDSTTQPADTSMEMTEELDATVEEEINHDAPQVDNMNLDGAADAPPTMNGDAVVPQTVQEARIPAKKDATLREFLGKMDEFAPIVCSLCLLRTGKY